MKKSTAVLVSIFIFIFFYVFFNGGDLANALDKSNTNSPLGVLFVYGLTWSFFISLSAGFYFIVLYTMKRIGPKKIALSTRRDFSTPLGDIKKKDPEFNPDLFLKNVGKLAEKLNHAWTKNKMGLVRNLVSAGIHNRFKIQLNLMERQGIQNIMQDWFLDSVMLIAVESDEVYQTAHVEIHAWAKDATLDKSIPDTKKYEILRDSPQTDYFEVWSFVRKVGAITKKEGGVLSGNCPNCGADIQDLGELNQCKHCKSIINSGEYDWVLAEITQKIEWNPNQSHGSDLLAEVRSTNPSINRQVIEDRASYIFWRWLEARSNGKPEMLSRDASPSVQKMISKSKEYIADAAVGSVDLKNIKETGGKFFVKVKILWSASFQVGYEPKHQRHLFTLSFPKNLTRKGGLSGNSCETCGAPLPESDSLQCEYCGAVVPPQVDDWILESVEKSN
jgi:hypothetical protein